MITLLLSLTLVFVFQFLFSSWWWIILIPLVIGFLERDSVARAILGNGAGVMLLWVIMSVFQWMGQGDVIVPRIAEVMGVGSGVVLVLATGLIGFLVAGLSGYAGFSLRRSLIKEYQVS